MQRDLLSICDISELLKRIYYIQPASSLQTILKHELYAERFVAHICGIALRGFILYKLFACWKMCVQQLNISPRFDLHISVIYISLLSGQ